MNGPIQGVVTLAGRLSRWRGRRRASPLWTLAVGLIVAMVALPVGAVLMLAFGPGDGTWDHLVSTVLPITLRDTAILLAGVGSLSLVVGVATAWVVTMFRFPGRTVIDRILVLPMAVPTYIVAYAYSDLLDYSGPLQGALRQTFGWTSARDYWFPEIRSTAGAVFVLSSVLYPYVYLTARASFVQQSVCALEVARTLGRTPFGAFVSVALPLARPALVAGLTLVLIECLNDIGAVQHLGVNTLAATIYATWLQRSSLAGAAQIATLLLALVFLLIVVEQWARGEGRSHAATGRYRSIPFSDLTGWRAWAAIVGCALPFVLGFLLPSLLLLSHVVHYARLAMEGAFWKAAGNSVLLAATSAVVAVAMGLILAYARRVAANGFTRPAVRIAGLGYALPGTVLALGLLMPLAAFDNRVDVVMRAWFGVSTGLLISGSLMALILAFAIRFLAVSLGTVEAGLSGVSPNLDAVARTLGESAFSSLWRVHLPLLIPSLGTAGLLVFVDAMKELPATILLRPMGFETLATLVYAQASLEQLEAASVGALAIVAVGLLPVLLLHKAIAEGRAGGGAS